MALGEDWGAGVEVEGGAGWTGLGRGECRGFDLTWRVWAERGPEAKAGGAGATAVMRGVERHGYF